MNAAPVMDPAEREPMGPPPTEFTNHTEQAEYSPELAEFLAALSQSYAESGDKQKAAELSQAEKELGTQNAAALAEVYLFSSGWELATESMSRQGNVEPAEIDAAAEKFSQSRRIFMEGCAAAYPYIPQIPRETVSPSAQEALDHVDKATSDLAVRLETSIAKGGTAQLNIDVMEIYRLQILRDQLEIELRRAGGREAKEEVAEQPPTLSAPQAENLQANEALRREVEGHYQRLGLQDEFGLTFDQWVTDDLRKSPDYKLFGEEPDDLEKWRGLERGIDEVRDWLVALKPEEKPTRYRELLEKLKGVLSQY